MNKRWSKVIDFFWQFVVKPVDKNVMLVKLLRESIPRQILEVSSHNDKEKGKYDEEYDK